MGFAGLDKVPAGVTFARYLSPGDTIPYIAAGGEKIGDVVERPAATDNIGIVTDLPPNLSSPTLPEVAVADAQISLRVTGVFAIKKKTLTDTWADGDRLAWDGTPAAEGIVAAATGAHEAVGASTATEPWAWVRINRWLVAATGAV